MCYMLFIWMKNVFHCHGTFQTIIQPPVHRTDAPRAQRSHKRLKRPYTCRSRDAGCGRASSLRDRLELVHRLHGGRSGNGRNRTSDEIVFQRKPFCKRMHG